MLQVESINTEDVKPPIGVSLCLIACCDKFFRLQGQCAKRTITASGCWIQFDQLVKLPVTAMLDVPKSKALVSSLCLRPMVFNLGARPQEGVVNHLEGPRVDARLCHLTKAFCVLPAAMFTLF